MNMALTAVSFGTMLVLLFTSLVLHMNASDAAERMGFKGSFLLRGLDTRSNITKAIAGTADMNERANLKAHLRRLSIAEFVLIPFAVVSCAIGIYFSLRL